MGEWLDVVQLVKEKLDTQTRSLMKHLSNDNEISFDTIVYLKSSVDIFDYAFRNCKDDSVLVYVASSIISCCEMACSFVDESQNQSWKDKLKTFTEEIHQIELRVFKNKESDID